LKISFVFTVDVDNDGMTAADERNTLVWNSVAEVPRIAAVFARHDVVATWFVRADNQLSEVYGDAAWLLHEHDRMWSDLRRDGHSIGWHPHVVTHDQTGFFVAETDDSRCAVALRTIYKSLSASGFPFAASRIGEAFHGNESMRALADLGITIDSTAIPGRRRDDASRRFDWSGTPNRPYRPSAADYRVHGTPALPIIEIPMTSVPVKAPYDSRPLLRYLNLAYREDIFNAAFQRHIESLEEGEHVVVTILHPEETHGPHGHALYAHDLGAVASNIEHLFTAAGSYGDVAVTTLDEVAFRLPAEASSCLI
jgi:hypothetical protein